MPRCIEFTDTPDRRVTLAVAADGLHLQVREPALRFDAGFGLRSDGDAQLFGVCRGSGAAPQRACLVLESGSPDDLCVTMRGADGRLMLAPTQLHRLAAA